MMPDQGWHQHARAGAVARPRTFRSSSGLDAGTLNDALLFGAVDYMVKPIELDTLKGKIERTFAALERRKKTP